MLAQGLTATARTTVVSKALDRSKLAPARRFAKARSSTTKTMALSQDELKKLVGYKSVDDHVTSGMVVGLGTGSTAYYAVERVGQKLASGELKDVICIPTSERTREASSGWWRAARWCR